ncbi:MAG: hypothetical protein H8D77_01790 [Chloroflexi bacterium]|nr:hypothetical protein [Chloroflexota bacterium]
MRYMSASFSGPASWSFTWRSGQDAKALLSQMEEIEETPLRAEMRTRL